MKITLVRHGEVLESYIGKYNGHNDIPLSQNGKLQAKEVAKELSKEIFDAVYCSDLLRAKQTLEAFALKQEVIFTASLREKSWGSHEGKSFEEIEDSGIKYENFEQWLNALDGEDIESYKENVKNFFQEEVFESSAKNILIVAHAGLIKTLLSLEKKLSLEEAFSTKLPYSSYITLYK